LVYCGLAGVSTRSFYYYSIRYQIYTSTSDDLQTSTDGILYTTALLPLSEAVSLTIMY
jgi:hypothetical protein